MIVGMGTTLVLAATAWILINGWTNYQHLHHVIDEDLGLKSEVQHLTHDFQNQIQEWKNVLIRGQDDKNREKYWSRVVKFTDVIQQKADKIIYDLHNVHMDEETAKMMEDFKSGHMAMFQAYQKGVQGLIDSDFDIGYADKLVAGVDRAPGKLLLQVSNIMEEESNIAVGQADHDFVSQIKIAVLLLVVYVTPFIQVSESQANRTSVVKDAGFTLKLVMYTLSIEDVIGTVS